MASGAAVCSLVLLLTACDHSNSQTIKNSTAGQSAVSRNMNQSNAPNVEVQTDIESLGKTINLPIVPSEAHWTEELFDNSKGAFPGPSDQRLTALMKFDDTGAAQMAAALAAQTPEKSLGSTDVKFWFPEEVKNAAQTADGRTRIEGAKYSPAAFFRAPYRNGNLIRVGETNYFVLNLFSF